MNVFPGRRQWISGVMRHSAGTPSHCLRVLGPNVPKVVIRLVHVCWCAIVGAEEEEEEEEEEGLFRVKGR